MITWLREGFKRNVWWSRLLFAGLFPFVGLLYTLINRLAAGFDQHYIWKFAFDDLIPFSKYFIIPYYYWYVQIIVSIAWFVFSPHTGRMLHRMTLAINFSMLISSLFFFFFPTEMIRPEVAGEDLFSQMTLMLYAADRPYNLFPSIHVAYSAVMARYWALAGPRKLWFRLINYGGTAFVIISTVFTKQHYSPDILGGLAVAWIAWHLSDRLFNRYGSRLLTGPAQTGVEKTQG
ncbi:MAG TPA: phosphoesterase PA-phosphatase [Clostridiales bacterium]|nr:phosphoesterase PA-phosphatase [Clostridiales bacterium]